MTRLANYSFYYIILISIIWPIREGLQTEIGDCDFNSFANLQKTDSLSPKCELTLKRAQNGGPQNGTEEPKCFQIDQKNIFKIMGDYEILVINCTASYLLTLDYDGFRPTEAVQVHFWRDLEISPTDLTSDNQTMDNFGVTTKLFGLSVEITSISKLFKVYRAVIEEDMADNFSNDLLHPNLTTPIIYSRTGKFTIRGMLPEDQKYSTSIYLFFEEPLMKNQPAFIQNQFTFRTKMLPNDKTILVPCRPSHYTEEVIVKVKTREVTQLGSFDPTIGFQMPISEALKITSNYSEFRCTFHHEASEAIWEGDESVWKVNESGYVDQFTLHRIDLAIDEEVLSWTYKDVHDKHTRDLTTICEFSNSPASNSSLHIFIVNSFIQFNHAREFVLPMYTKLSYFVQTGQWVKGQGLTVDRSFAHGIAFCGNEQNYQYTEFAAAPLLKIAYPIPPGTDFALFPYAGFDGDIFFDVTLDTSASLQELYVGQKVKFHCSIGLTNPINHLPLVWFITDEKSVHHMVLKDQSVIENSTLEIRLDVSMKKVTCLGMLWQANEKYSSIHIHVKTNGTTPVIQERAYKFKELSQDQLLICTAKGEPQPLVWWERNGQVLTPPEKGYAKYTIKKVTKDSLGLYVCHAKNALEETRTEFHIMSVHFKSDLWILLQVGLPLIILMGLAFLGLWFYIRSKKMKNVLSAVELEEFRNGVQDCQHNEYAVNPACQPYLTKWEIPSHRFTIQGESLGEGAFGVVTKGTVDGVTVAVKRVREGVDGIYLKSLLMELKILMHLGTRPNLIQLVGAHTKHLSRGVVYVFVQFCDGGDLRSHLIKNRSKFLEESQNEDSRKNNLRILHEWAHQLANGMSFLTTKKIIHGDLAARNVLLMNSTVKITDFGLSRQLYNYTMYLKKNQEPLPWRWLSLESLSDLQFSIESDIWSYGVTLWEIYSLGSVPYPEMRWTPNFVNIIREGFRMDCPPLISAQWFAKFIIPCWNKEPQQRPTFKNLCNLFEKSKLADIH